MTNPIKLAAGAKGSLALLNRIRMIGQRYGWTPTRMDQTLLNFAKMLQSFDCCATFPITAVVVERHPKIIERYQAQGIEFAVHGYTHIDYSQLIPEKQLGHLRRAREVFSNAGIAAVGFRSPYLRRESHLYTAIETAGFSYVSNQPMMWDVLDSDTFSSSAAYLGYKRALDFYDPWLAKDQPSLPKLRGRLVDIPVSLPDDEILVDRMAGQADGLIEKAWLRILAQTYQQDELFAMQLHPERIVLCADSLSAVLSEARSFTPPVWIARLDEIATWWRNRSKTTVAVTNIDNNQFHLTVTGPTGIVVLVRAVEVDVPTVRWDDDYEQVKTTEFTISASLRPFIGLSPVAVPQLADFLRQQGYIVEVSQERHRYAYYFDQVEFSPENERSLLDQIETANCPLVRLGRWPNGNRSALSITGDIDALTLVDYGLRFFGR